MPINIDLNIIYKTLTNDVFYEYDSSTNRLVKQPIYEDLIQLKNRLVSCNNMKERSKDFHTQLTEIMNRNSKQSSVAINPVHLLEILVYFSNIIDIHLISVNVIKILDSGTYNPTILCNTEGLFKKLLAK